MNPRIRVRQGESDPDAFGKYTGFINARLARRTDFSGKIPIPHFRPEGRDTHVERQFAGDKQQKRASQSGSGSTAELCLMCFDSHFCRRGSYLLRQKPRRIAKPDNIGYVVCARQVRVGTVLIPGR